MLFLIFIPRYVANGEIGNKSLKEVLYFNISDASHNVLPSQVLSVLITAVDNQPPVVQVGPAVEVSLPRELNCILCAYLCTHTLVHTHMYMVVWDVCNHGCV